MTDPGKPNSETSRLGFWGWFGIAALFVFLAAALLYAVHAWNMLGGVRIAAAGWVFLVLGVAITIIVGAGLMALLFYSSRKGRDF